MWAYFLMPPLLLVRISIAAVWVYEGLWCKLMGRMPSQFAMMIELPGCTPERAVLLLRTLGLMEMALALWVLSGDLPPVCALVQTVFLVLLNTNGLLWARHLIYDPAGMVVKNLAFLMLVWIGGAGPGTSLW